MGRAKNRHHVFLRTGERLLGGLETRLSIVSLRRLACRLVVGVGVTVFIYAVPRSGNKPLFQAAKIERSVYLLKMGGIL